MIDPLTIRDIMGQLVTGTRKTIPYKGRARCIWCKPDLPFHLIDMNPLRMEYGNRTQPLSMAIVTRRYEIRRNDPQSRWYLGVRECMESAAGRVWLAYRKEYLHGDDVQFAADWAEIALRLPRMR